MIKVIKHGTKRTAVCEKCGCIFSFEEEDINTVHMGMNEYQNEVPCPECGNRVRALGHRMLPTGGSAI